MRGEAGIFTRSSTGAGRGILDERVVTAPSVSLPKQTGVTLDRPHVTNGSSPSTPPGGFKRAKAAAPNAPLGLVIPPQIYSFRSLSVSSIQAFFRLERRGEGGTPTPPVRTPPVFISVSFSW